MSEPIAAEFLVAPPGSTVVVRCTRALSPEKREVVKQWAEALIEKNPGVRFVIMDGADWDVCVIGAPEPATPYVPAELVASEDTRLDDVLSELQALRRVSASVLEALRRWDADGLPPVRPADDGNALSAEQP